MEQTAAPEAEQTAEQTAPRRRIRSRRWRDISFTVHDGLTLHAREYGRLDSPRTPVLCLPGLTRNSKDFHDIASHLGGKRRVIACDYRGRGRSDYADDIRTYSVAVEMADVFQLMTLAHMEEAAIIGTSRGGIIAMLMAAARPAAVKGAILNDIGPVIEPKGLLRIAGYVRNMPKLSDWGEAVAILKSIHGGFFTDLDDDEWEAFAKSTYRDEDGRPVVDFDPRIAKALDSQMDASTGEVPAVWAQFAALLEKPVLVIRGEHSDLLSTETVDQMRTLKPDLISATVPGQGHAPLLNDAIALDAIDAFLEDLDGS